MGENMVHDCGFQFPYFIHAVLIFNEWRELLTLLDKVAELAELRVKVPIIVLIGDHPFYDPLILDFIQKLSSKDTLE